MGDVMLFGVLEMPESMWKDDSRLDRAQRRSRYVQAAQRIRDQDEQLATKDAEIAEAGATIADMANTILRLNRERDEARECAGTLCGALRDIGAYSDEGASGKLAMTGNYAWFDEPASVRKAREALAATPEHLRGNTGDANERG